MNVTYKEIKVSSSGGTFIENFSDNITSYRISTNTGAPITLANDATFNFSDTIPQGVLIYFYIKPGDFTKGSYNFEIYGKLIEQWQLDAGVMVLLTNAAGLIDCTILVNFAEQDVISGDAISDGSIALTKLNTATQAYIIQYNSSGIATATGVSGDITISNTGVVTIANNAITNAKVSSTAAIARSKLATGSANVIVTNNGSGVMSEQATVTTAQGGLGTNASSSTGFVKFSSGTASISSITDDKIISASFETDETGLYLISFPFDCTVTGVDVVVTGLIEASNNGSVNFKNYSNVNMIGNNLVSGTLEVAAGDTVGTGYTSTITGNNTFNAGEVIKIFTTKTTKGGRVQITVRYERVY